MLYTVVGRFRNCGNAWSVSVNSLGIREAAQDAIDKIKHDDARSLPPGSYRDAQVMDDHMNKNIEVLAVVVGNHVTRVKGEW